MGCNETRPEQAKHVPENSSQLAVTKQSPTDPQSDNTSTTQTSIDQIKGEAEKWKSLAQENIQRLQEVTLRFSEMTCSHEEMYINYKQLEQLFMFTSEELQEEINAKLQIEDEFKISQYQLNALIAENQQLRLEMEEIQKSVAELLRQKANHLDDRVLKGISDKLADEAKTMFYALSQNFCEMARNTQEFVELYEVEVTRCTSEADAFVHSTTDFIAKCEELDNNLRALEQLAVQAALMRKVSAELERKLDRLLK